MWTSAWLVSLLVHISLIINLWIAITVTTINNAIDFSDRFEPEPMDASAPPTYSLDDIKVEHHPNSGIKAKIHSFNNFHRRPAASSAYTTPNNHPWRPFQSRLEFEVAELALEVGLNNEQTDCLIKICHQCSLRKDSFTLKNHKDIHSKWEAASHRITKVVPFVFLLYGLRIWPFSKRSSRKMWSRSPTTARCGTSMYTTEIFGSSLLTYFGTLTSSLTSSSTHNAYRSLMGKPSSAL